MAGPTIVFRYNINQKEINKNIQLNEQQKYVKNMRVQTEMTMFYL